MSLEIRDLHAAYGSLEALCGVTLEIQPGEIVGVIGENAAGKTTLARAIAGTIQTKSGAVLVDGDAIHDFPPFDRLRCGVTVVPEGRGIVPTLTVRDNLWLGTYARQERRRLRAEIEDVERLMPLLAERRRQLAGTLSGGEQQMLALARARLTRPKYLVLDEPLIGLSPGNAAQAIDSVRAFAAAEGVGILILEQSDRAIRLACARVYEMKAGQVRSMAIAGLMEETRC